MPRPDRTYEQMIAGDPTRVMLGSREFLLAPLPRSKARAWRGRVQALIGGADATSGGADAMLDLIYEYNDALAADREWIEDNATDEQIKIALEACLEMSVGPLFGLQIDLLTRLTGLTREALISMIPALSSKPSGTESTATPA